MPSSKHKRFLPTRKLVKKIKNKKNEHSREGENKRGKGAGDEERRKRTRRARAGMHSTTGAACVLWQMRALATFQSLARERHEIKEGRKAKGDPSKPHQAIPSTTRPAPNAKAVTISCIVSLLGLVLFAGADKARRAPDERTITFLRSWFLRPRLSRLVAFTLIFRSNHRKFIHFFLVVRPANFRTHHFSCTLISSSGRSCPSALFLAFPLPVLCFMCVVLDFERVGALLRTREGVRARC